jgi:adenosylhomocysteine nucleosidase
MAEKAARDLPELTIRRGSVATGDSFLNDVKKIDIIRERFPAVAAAEMEAASIAQTCHQFRKPFVIIRSISDKADGNASISFETFIKTAARNSAKMVLGIIGELREYVDEKEYARMTEGMYE